MPTTIPTAIRYCCFLVGDDCFAVVADSVAEAPPASAATLTCTAFHAQS